jgi:hypothetical protein
MTQDPVAEIKRIYFATSKATILRDFDRAIDLLKSIAAEEERERAAVYMDGLAQMRSEWGIKNTKDTKGTKGTKKAHKR